MLGVSSYQYWRNPREAMREPVLLGGDLRISMNPQTGRPFNVQHSEKADSGYKCVTTELQSVPTLLGPTLPATVKPQARVRWILRTNVARPLINGSDYPSKNDSDKTPTSQMRETMSSGTDTEYFDLGAGSNIADFSLAEPEAGR